MSTKASKLSFVRNQLSLLRKVQNDSMQPFYQHLQVQSRQSDTNADHPQKSEQIHRKWKATVQLLSEALEEQSNLRALLEVTMSNTDNSLSLDSLLQFDIFHLSQQNLNDFSLIPNHLKRFCENSKTRALLLEQEQIISQVSSYHRPKIHHHHSHKIKYYFF
jgi:hypothetical protein